MMTEYDPQHGHLDHEQHDQQQQRSTTLERGRSVKIMRNGDSFFPGRAFVINQRKYPLLDVFLDDASQALRANFGAVRCIYTPKNGTRLRDITELEDHQTYVASGGERFKKLHYLDIAEGKRVPNKVRSLPKLPPLRRYDVEGRALRLSRSENVIIYVYRNGDPLTLPSKILLVKPTLQNWESVLDEVTRKVSLSYSAVLKLYAMNGELITSAQQLEYNGMYVAAGKERFKRIEYPDPKSFSPNSSPKMSRKSYTKSDGTNTHTTTANSHGSNEQAGHRRPVREEYDFFNNKPQQHRRGPTKETDLDRDDGGVYKGRVNHRERIREIDDTRDTKVDLPVDYREAETVEEENLYGNAGKTPRRQHQPPSQPKSNQAFNDSRHHSPPVRAAKTPPKNYDDDDNNNKKHHIPAMNNGHQQNNHHSTNKNNGHDNEHRRHTPPAPTKVDDEINDDHDEHRRFHSPKDQNQRSHSPKDQHQRSYSPKDRHQRSHSPKDQHQRSYSPKDRHQLVSSGKQPNTKDENSAAIVIQSRVRGYLTRKHTHQEHEENTDRLTNNSHHNHQEQQQDEAPEHEKNESDQHQHLSQPTEHHRDEDDDDNV